MIATFDEMTSLSRDVMKLNFDYLRLMREMARGDVMQAQQRFGVSGAVARRVARLTLEDLQELASSPSFLFTLRSNNAVEIMLSAMTAPDAPVRIDGLRLATLVADQRSPVARFQQEA